MKAAPLPAIVLVAAASMFAALVRAQENRTITISSDSYAAIAYSPTTGKYTYAYDLRSRSAAENVALEKCGEDAPRLLGEQRVLRAGFGLRQIVLGNWL
jgi:hypothetical protein